MFNYISGILTVKQPTSIVLDVGGLGYEISIPLSTFQNLPELNDKVKLQIHFHVREDNQQLFGFFTKDEKELFRVLLSVSGIGPKVALAMLSSFEAIEIKSALVSEDVSFLTQIPGIGKKTAERLIVELKEKIVVDGKIQRDKLLKPGSHVDEVFNVGLAALTQLGYKRVEADKAMRKVIEKQGKDISVEELLKESLKNI